MGKTSYKGLRIDYQPKQKVKVMLGRDWFDAEVVKSNKKTVIVNTLFSRTKYRRVPIKPEDIAGAGKAGILAAAIAATSQVPGGLGTTLEPYTVSGTRVVKLPRIRVKPIERTRHEAAVEVVEELVKRLESPSTPVPQETVEEASVPVQPAPFVSRLTETMLENIKEVEPETKPETAADVLAELEKMLE